MLSSSEPNLASKSISAGLQGITSSGWEGVSPQAETCWRFSALALKFCSNYEFLIEFLIGEIMGPTLQEELADEYQA